MPAQFGRINTVGRGKMEYSACRTLGTCTSIVPRTWKERFFVWINAHSHIFCESSSKHLRLTGFAIELHRANMIRQYP